MAKSEKKKEGNDMKHKLLAQLFRIVPQKAISASVGKMAKSHVSRPFIPFYVKYYGVSTHEMEKSLKEYPNLTSFFTRKLIKDARPIHGNKETIVSPVDGTLSSFGKIQKDTLIQAKGISYSLIQLLGDKEKAKKYENGSYLTIYLSPKDYHRIHVPFGGTVTKSTYIPGKLYPVNKIGVEGVDGLFTKNERMITYVDTSDGEMALVKVGAFIVGSVVVDYPLLGITRTGKTIEHEEFCEPLNYPKGEEIGYFQFGSTVILLFEKDKFTLKEDLFMGQILRMGERIGSKKE